MKLDSLNLQKTDLLQTQKIILRHNIDRQITFNKKFVLVEINKKSINIKLNLKEEDYISPYIIGFCHNYSELNWIFDYLKKVLNISCLFFLNLKVDKESKEVIIYNRGLSKIVYKYQNIFISKEDLDRENQKYLERNINCRWFFGGKADNKISENWSYQIYGEYLYFIKYSDSISIEARQLLPNNSVGFPLNIEEEGAMIRKIIYK